MSETDSALSALFVLLTDIIGSCPSPSRTSIFSPLALRRAIAFTNRVEKPWHRSLKMYSRRLVLQRRIYLIDTNLHCVSWYTRRRGRIDSVDRSREKFRVPSVARVIQVVTSIKIAPTFICNASPVLAPQNIKLEKRDKKTLKRIKFRYKKKMLKIHFVTRFIDEIELRTNTFVSQLTVTVHDTVVLIVAKIHFSPRSR